MNVTVVHFREEGLECIFDGCGGERGGMGSCDVSSFVGRGAADADADGLMADGDGCGWVEL